jgi:hypothetical protein
MTAPPVRPRILIAILWLAIALRLFGVALNNQSNDDHLSVIKVIAYEHRIPADNELWEAFQPKLYHATVAGILDVLPPLSDSWSIRVAEAVSCAAGIATLLVLLAFLRGLPISARAQQLTFALVALNPKMVATSIEATNDAFVILFATIAFAAGYRFFRKFSGRSFAAMTAGVLLACISKGPGLVTAVAVACAFGSALLWPTIARRRILAFAAAFLVAFALFVAPLGQYWSRYRAGNSPLAINEPYVPPPHFLEETFVRRPGVTSVVNTFLTFRLFNLLADPQITNDVAVYPRHRTSFWTAAYGSMHSIHYDYYPPDWQTHNGGVRWLLRLTWILALLPTGMLVAGTARSAWQATVAILRRRFAHYSSSELLLVLGALGYLGFLLLFTSHERDFGSMKPIYIYEAALPFMVCCARELERIGAGSRRRLSSLLYGSATLLCLAYLAEELILLGQLLLLRLHLT